jgi:hypothetical protein
VFCTTVPKCVDPVTISTEAVIVCTIKVCAVNVPLTVKLSAEDAVNAFKAQLAVPCKDPVIDGDIMEEALTCPTLYMLFPPNPKLPDICLVPFTRRY